MLLGKSFVHWAQYRLSLSYPRSVFQNISGEYIGDTGSTAQDSFYKRHTAEEVALAHANRMDLDHPDAIDMPMFATVRLFVYVYIL